MIDRHALLATLKPLVSELEDSIRLRALDTPEVAEHLEREHHRAVVAERTAMSLEEWRDGEITQAAVAWVLGCVFVRFLEDNGLVDQALISGPGGRRAAALGHREEHFRAHPAHSDREYLEACFRSLATYPAVAPLYDERHNPLWRLGPTADGARGLRETFTAIDPTTGDLVHDFTDPDLDTRFLGDLYQDLSDTAKKRYALLQTPEFVERFILDRTLDPAITEFGLEEVRLIDPACGSGHFLIGAFNRLFAQWQAREPATALTVLAQRCLDHVAGVDLNPYATAIARFRLVIASLGACGIARLAEAPALRTHIATGDSLLHGPLPVDGATMLFDANRTKLNVAHVYETEDASELKEILGRGYHAVVGNPPYIAGDDSALRDAYRARYESATSLFTLNVPFMERFFELGQVSGDDGRNRAGFVGKITANNFLKREFGSVLVERILASLDVQAIIDTSGAHIPGHGTPTVLVFGRSRAPVGATIRVVDGVRGESSQPVDPANGAVWSSIKALVDHPGQQDQYARSSDVARREILQHPMSLGMGRDLRKRLEAHETRVGHLADAVGRIAASSADDVLDRPVWAWRVQAPHVVASVDGAATRDWAAPTNDACFFPYSVDGLTDPSPAEERILWPHRTVLWARRTFSKKSYREDDKPWWSWHQVALPRLRSPLSLAWGEVATHNHFVLDRSGKVFKQTAPVIKLPQDGTEQQLLGLAGVLNSSVACFWLKQVAMNKGGGGINEGHRGDAWEFFFQFAATKVKDLPLPPRRSPELAATLDRLASERAGLLDDLASLPESTSLADHVAALGAHDARLTSMMVSRQEELDWQVLASYGLVPDTLPILGNEAPPISFGHRAFEIVLARQLAAGEIETTWFARHGYLPVVDVPTTWPEEYRDLVNQRVALIESDPALALVERPEHKRRWNRAPWQERVRDALTALVLVALERRDVWDDLRPRSTNELTDWLRRDRVLVEALEILTERKDAELAATLTRVVLDAAVPFPAAARLSEKGLRKREVWERVWDLQRAEDRGEDVGAIPVPPHYGPADFNNSVAWKHRGKLDVPSERFVLIPNAERGADISPVVGWAGWNERDLARALAGRVTELRQEQAAEADRLVPLLGGVLELLPWIHQWHPERDPLYGGPPGAFFEGWLDGELAALGVTREALRAWRPAVRTRGRKAKASTS